MAEAESWVGPRRLLRRLRDIMAGPGTAQERLDRITTIIARDMVAEVCSIYVRRAGDILELFSTEGLRKDAVHRTRLRIGEGLVGFVAAQAMPVALADAQSHPLFAYRPETGEEIFSSLMGVPILRGGRLLGVLVVQNRTQRNYADEEVETLETTAMVLAEIIIGARILNADEIRYGNEPDDLPQRLEGIALSPGLAQGTALLHRQRVSFERMISDDPDSEESRVREALDALQGHLDAMLARPELAKSGEHRDVLETFRMFARDQGWLRRIVEAIRSGLSAEAAVQRVQDDARTRMAQVTDAYLRERLLDLEDLTNRLLQHLTGGIEDGMEMPGNTILVARSLGPAELLNYDQSRLRAVVLEEGSANAHATIVARALGIPMVGRVGNALSRVESGDPLLVDADNGVAYLRPGEEVRANFDEAMAARGARIEAYRSLRHLPAETRDGIRISMRLNAGLLADMGHLADTGVEGIGLYRTEIPFMVRSSYPEVGTQIEFYRRVFDEAAGQPVVFRTLDIGGDKALPYVHSGAEENPAMGWRAVRIALDRPAMLRQQVRALIQAAEGRPLSVMFPMIAQFEEFRAARRLLDLELARARSHGARLPAEVQVGAMLEVPALAMQLPVLLPNVDFLSIGSNDLVQFLFASDRGNPRLEGRYDTLAPAVLKFLGRIAQDCAAAGVPVTVCGEMAGDPLGAMALIALGYRSLSMSPANVGPVKAMIRTLDGGASAAYVTGLLDMPVKTIRPHMKSFAHDHKVDA